MRLEVEFQQRHRRPTSLLGLRQVLDLAAIPRQDGVSQTNNMMNLTTISQLELPPSVSWPSSQVF